MTGRTIESRPSGTAPTATCPACGRDGDDSYRLLLSPDDAAQALSISRSKLYRLIREGHVESVMLGGCRRIPVASLERLVEVLLSQARGTKGCPHSGPKEVA